MRESGEMYLETILVMTQRGHKPRSVDLAAELGYSKPSVSRAIGILRDGGYLLMEKTGELTLTQKGELLAGNVYERHRLISRFLTLTLGIDEALAREDACKIEHIVSDQTFSAIKEFIKKNDE